MRRPYGYVMTNHKTMQILRLTSLPPRIVREIFELYKNGWGYKENCKITLPIKKFQTPRNVRKKCVRRHKARSIKKKSNPPGVS